MLKLAILALFGSAAAETVLIHPGDQGLCIRADAPSEREQLSLGRCSTSAADVRRWDIDDDGASTLIRLHGSSVCLTGGVHRTWDGELEFDPEDGDHVVLRACPEGPHIPAGYAWVRHDSEKGLSFRLDLGEDWYLDASNGAAVYISDKEPETGWTLEAADSDDGEEEEDATGKQRIKFWEAVGDILEGL
ncbi:hypothetical protein CC85DRAFT_293004 [Cutaneotrichosporon oleaginosum]|uniref:Uncharacterized protein n=1 Tax=Cutaneotrichosporon oleaginosum TaxID=879819 RepID=A0A0J0XIE0_9TREE|nr:uncharacterized protein CC85DRAFT_293004 [Cutaneotrichosporon oleaginosum]KLT40787.1 hypothetical protein CC85DRAFT_293004 [Cutaneotrichosporon oleaginosum]TXT11901.1 hypothetical protein COLE_02311 [Cutaneotrichosporon oleaginosum]